MQGLDVKNSLRDVNWQAVAMIVFVMASVAILFGESIVILQERWANPDEPYGSSYLIIGLSCYLIYHKLKYASGPSLRIDWLSVLALIGTCLIWFVGQITHLQLLSQIVIPAIVFSLFWVFLGWPVAKSLIPPVALLYVTIPVWGILGVPLRLMAVEVVEFILNGLGIPAFIDVYTIEMVSGTVVVAGGCSGQNYLLTGISIGSFYAIQYLHGISRYICLFSVIALSIIGNWIRIILLVLIGHQTNMQHELMNDHSTFGWVIFGVVMVVFFIAMRKLELAVGPNPDTQEPKSIESNGTAQGVTSVLFSGRAISLLVFLAMFPALLIYARYSVSPEVNLTLDDMAGISVNSEASWLPAYKGYDEAQSWTMSTSDASLELVALIYREQKQGKELVHETNRVQANITDSDSGVLELADNRKVRYRKSKESDRQWYFWVYRVADWHTTSPFYAKLLEVPASIGPNNQSAVLAFRVECFPRVSDCDVANEQWLSLIGDALNGLSWSDANYKRDT